MLIVLMTEVAMASQRINPSLFYYSTPVPNGFSIT